MIDEIRWLFERHLPHYEVHSITKLGEGLDNIAFDINGELVVRKSTESDIDERRELVDREAELLGDVVKWSPLPVPEVVFADRDAGVLTFNRLPGVPLGHHPVPEPERLAPDLGEFIGRLHRTPVADMEPLAPRDDDPLSTWLEDAEGDYGEIADQLPDDARDLIEDFLDRDPPPEPTRMVFCHNDLGAEHILVDVETSTITGIIDWTDAAITDPAHDFARIARDLGPDVYRLTLASYGCPFGDADRERVAFYARCSLIEDIAYGLRTGAYQYTEAGLAHLPWTFTEIEGLDASR